MDADALLAAVEDDYETELSRLGSSKAIYAVTGGEMEPDAVLEAMADRALAAAETLDAWAADADGEAAALFSDVADEERERAGRLADAAGVEAAEKPTPLEEHLRALDGAPGRAGGLLAWTLATDRTLSQAVGFFVGNADTRSADLFRDLRSATDEHRERTLALLDSLCASDAEWERAEAAAGAAVEAAYAHYAESLESMGIKVKPVC